MWSFFGDTVYYQFDNDGLTCWLVTFWPNWLSISANNRTVYLTFSDCGKNESTKAFSTILVSNWSRLDQYGSEHFEVEPFDTTRLERVNWQSDMIVKEKVS